jgi:23S rRNA-/tRNA-specific pseudouridylate synthase
VRVAEKNELPSANLGSIQRLESQILFEDDAMIVLNKPSGMAVHGGSGLSFGVIEGLRALRPEARFLELVHRLDRDTSGVLLVARSAVPCAACTSSCGSRPCASSTWRWCAASGSLTSRWSMRRCAKMTCNPASG